MMVYIKSGSCISVQNTFAAQEDTRTLQPLTFPAKPVEPDYKNYINPTLLRRMSPVVRYGVATALDCLQRAQVQAPGAIITGTGLGGLQDTQKFLETIIRNESDTLSPTSFIQSTHNTVSGQIALQTQCRGYNMTYVQNGLSFEYALQDACWLAEEGKDHILAGGADEKTPFLNEAAAQLNIVEAERNKISEGAACFLLSGKKEHAIAGIGGVCCTTNTQHDILTSVNDFLAQHALTSSDIDGLLYAVNSFDQQDTIASQWKGAHLRFTDYCGYYHTNSAFGMFLAVQLLGAKVQLPGWNSGGFKNILVLNSYAGKSLGLILIRQP